MVERRRGGGAAEAAQRRRATRTALAVALESSKKDSLVAKPLTRPATPRDLTTEAKASRFAFHPSQPPCAASR